MRLSFTGFCFLDFSCPPQVDDGEKTRDPTSHCDAVAGEHLVDKSSLFPSRVSKQLFVNKLSALSSHLHHVGNE